MCILDLFVLRWGLAFVKLLNRAYNEFQNLRNTHFSPHGEPSFAQFEFE